MRVILFFVSNLLLVYWIYLVVVNKKGYTFGVRLTRNQIFALIAAEVIVLALLVVEYWCSLSHDITTDFVWHSYLSYPRGILPAVLITQLLNSNSLLLLLPLTLFFALLVDYILLLLATWLVTKRRIAKS